MFSPRLTHISRRLLLLAMTILIAAGALCFLATGCRTGQQCRIDNYGTLNYTQTVASSPVVNSKETPFDVFRGLGQGSAVSAAPGATSTQSGSGTFDNANALAKEPNAALAAGNGTAPAANAVPVTTGALPKPAVSASPAAVPSPTGDQPRNP